MKNISELGSMKTWNGGLYFFGNCTGRVRDNSMSNHKYGFWLDNGADIGSQGGLNSPAENTWENGGSASTNWSVYTGLTPSSANIRLKTYVSNATAENQPMFVRSLSNQNPNDSWGQFLNNNIPLSFVDNTLFITNGNWPKPCNSAYLEGPGEVDLDEIFAFDERLLAMESMSMQLDSSQMEAPWEIINEHETFEELKRNPEMRDSSILLDEFYAERESENLALLRSAEDFISAEDYAAASAILQNILPNDLIELSHKSVLELLVKHLTQSFTEIDSLDLAMWAESCSYLYGVGVSKAQALYNDIYRSTEIFDEVCPESVPRSALLSSQNEKEIKLSLYPNPTKDKLYVESSAPEINTGICIITSVDGREIYRGSIHFLRGLDLTPFNLSQGVYLIEILVSEKSVLHKDKFVFAD